MFFVIYAVMAIVLAFIIYFVVGFICLMSMDTGPDWLPVLVIPVGIIGYVIAMIYITGLYDGWVNSL